jgi:hypothetical protein
MAAAALLAAGGAGWLLLGGGGLLLAAGLAGLASAPSAFWGAGWGGFAWGSTPVKPSAKS